MPPETSPPQTIRPEDLLRESREQLLTLNEKIRYFSLPPLAEEDLRHYIHDPITALPPAALAQLPRLTILLVPYLERKDGRGPVRVSTEPVPELSAVLSHIVEDRDCAALFFAIREEEVSEYHFTLYHRISELLAESWTKDAAAVFLRMVKQELAGKVNGEIDEKSWQMKQELQEKHATKNPKALREYAKQAFIDTATLYLHGICCDIDVETGPRQMPSRNVRKRLEILHDLYPPPAGHAVFPEELSKLRSASRLAP